MELFRRLGEQVEQEWRHNRFAEAAFPQIAGAALDAAELQRHIGANDVLRWAVSAASLPEQIYTSTPFGEPAIQVYQSESFFIEVLHWLDGSTSIHEHGFHGAFHVLTGSSLHSLYHFDEAQRFGESVRIGRVSLDRAECLRAGDTRLILAGSQMSHSLFHLDRPSVTVVVRTRRAASGGPQLNYYKPGLAVDPFAVPNALDRRIAALQALMQCEPAALVEALSQVLNRADPLELTRVALDLATSPSAAKPVRVAFESATSTHGELQPLLGVLDGVIVENQRQRWLLSMRGMVTAPGPRMLLGLLANFSTRAPMLEMLTRGQSQETPQGVLASWISQAADLIPSSVAAHELDRSISVPTVIESMLLSTTVDDFSARLRDAIGADTFSRHEKDVKDFRSRMLTSPLYGPAFRDSL